MVEFPLAHPPTRLFAYVNSYPNDQVMGIVIDGRTGKVLETLILPTKQRVMLGLGVANDNAHAHHMYRRLYPHGYRLIWTDDPKTDIRLENLKGRLEKSAGALKEVEAIGTESDAGRTIAAHTESNETLPATGQLTADIMRGGVEKEKAVSTNRERSPVETDRRDIRTGGAGEGSLPDTPRDPTEGGFY